MSKSNYYINSITIGATDGSPAQTNITIQASAPSSYSTLGSSACTYKVYRSGNNVIVVINKATEAISIVGNAAGNLTVTGGANITNLGFTRATCSTTTATVSATFGSGFYPQFSYNGGSVIKVSTAAGSGKFGAVNYSFTFDGQVFTLTFSGLPTGYTAIPTVALSTRMLDSARITVNIADATCEILYDMMQAIVVVQPNNPSNYIISAYVDGNSAYPETISYYRGILVRTGSAFSIDYIASDSTNRMKFIVEDLTADMTLTLITSNTKPVLKMGGGAEINGVALQTRLSGNAAASGAICLGNAAITGYSTYAGVDKIIVFATASAGYAFSHWEVDGTTLKDDTNTPYGISAFIPYDEVDGKILVAVFTAISADVDDKTDTGDHEFV